MDLEVPCHEKSRPHCQDLELVLEQGLEMELELAPVLAPASYQALNWPSWMAGLELKTPIPCFLGGSLAEIFLSAHPC